MAGRFSPLGPVGVESLGRIEKLGEIPRRRFNRHQTGPLRAPHNSSHIVSAELLTPSIKRIQRVHLQRIAC